MIKGVTGFNLQNKDEKMYMLNEVHQMDKNALLVLGGCHTVAMADNQLVGDPIEKQAFEGIQWKHDGRRSSYAN